MPNVKIGSSAGKQSPYLVHLFSGKRRTVSHSQKYANLLRAVLVSAQFIQLIRLCKVADLSREALATIIEWMRSSVLFLFFWAKTNRWLCETYSRLDEGQSIKVVRFLVMIRSSSIFEKSRKNSDEDRIKRYRFYVRRLPSTAEPHSVAGAASAANPGGVANAPPSATREPLPPRG